MSANRASLDRLNTFVSAEYELTDNVEAFVDVLIARRMSRLVVMRRLQHLAQRFQGTLETQIGGTFGCNIWLFPLGDIGTRDNVVNDDLTDINLGLRGEINEDVSWEAYATLSEYRSTSMGRFYLSYCRA